MEKTDSIIDYIDRAISLAYHQAATSYHIPNLKNVMAFLPGTFKNELFTEIISRDRLETYGVSDSKELARQINAGSFDGLIPNVEIVESFLKYHRMMYYKSGENFVHDAAISEVW